MTSQRFKTSARSLIIATAAVFPDFTFTHLSPAQNSRFNTVLFNGLRNMHERSSERP
jgi:hypothetical protein